MRLKLFLSVLIFFPPTFAAAADRFVRLTPPGSQEILERSHEIDVICPEGKSIAKVCREDALKAVTRELRLFSAPKLDALSGDRVVVAVKPGRGLHALFYRKGSDAAVEYEPDQYDEDWTTSLVFDFAVQTVEGDWVELARRGSERPLWINTKEDWKAEPLLVGKDGPRSPAALKAKMKKSGKQDMSL